MLRSVAARLDADGSLVRYCLVPHFAQNFAPERRGCRQFLQYTCTCGGGGGVGWGGWVVGPGGRGAGGGTAGAMVFPQAAQNLAPTRTGLPQCGQAADGATTVGM